MKTTAVLLICLASTAILSAGPAGDSAESQERAFPFRLIKLSERVLVFKTGELVPWGVNVTAIATEKGIVVIDTGLVPGLAREFRRNIEQEFGRSDFAYVINTHHHFDHTNGNQVFSDATIIGHQKCPAYMQSFADNLENELTGIARELVQIEEELNSLDPDTDEAKVLKENLFLNNAMIEDLRSDYVLTPPTLTFSDRITLDLGDLTLELVYYGPAHTEGDILIYIPEAKLLATGDLFWKGSLDMVRPEINVDVPRWLETLNSLLDEDKEIEHVIGGHDMTTPEEMRSRCDYIRELWDGVIAAQKEGLDADAASDRLSLDGGFSSIRNYMDITSERTRNEHNMNIMIFFRQLQESAAAKLEALIRDQDLEKALIEFNDKIRQGNLHYIDEREFNALGYRLLNAGSIEAALAVFTINTEEFPDSWNTWDSLGEAYTNAGDKDKAIAYYQKSLELNPQNRNATSQIQRIDGIIFDRSNQTKEANRFHPGENTGLKGSYLGQQPPGLEPKVFAPGIVSIAEGFEFSCTFSPDGKEFYFNRGTDIWWSHLTDEGWTAPEPAPFNTPQLDHEPHISLDGSRLFFGSNRPRAGVDGNPYGIWMMERAGDGWGEPQFILQAMYVSSTLDGTIICGDMASPEGGVLFLRPTGDGYSAPVKLQCSTTTGHNDDWHHPAISPDGGFIIFDSMRAGALGGEGDSDFYLSFLKDDGSWSEASHLTDISTPGDNMCAYITPDGKYLFYHAARDIYWVSTEAINQLKNK